MKKRPLRSWLYLLQTLLSPSVLLSVPTLLSLTATAQAPARGPAQHPQKSDLLLWDNKPARQWMTEAYPMGNGNIGGMVFGGLSTEHIQFNEHSLWTGDESNTGAYQAFGDLFIDFQGKDSTTPIPTDYRRELDIGQALQRITYTENGIPYQREYFCSYPDQVMVLHFTAGKKGSYSSIISLKDAHGAHTTARGMTLTITGKLDNGMRYEAAAWIRPEGGSAIIEPEGKEGKDGRGGKEGKNGRGGYRLNIQHADGFTILLAAATDYSNKRSANWKGEDPAAKVQRILAAASAKPYQRLLSAHRQDYESLFGRVALTLGNTPAGTKSMPTFQRLIDYKKTPDHDLEALIFQYGRYLLISSSRKGGLPANLQGIWNESNDPPWRCDYHSNINIEMNYWPAEPANLSECAIPYLDYINSMREVKKESTQKEYPGVRGWTVKTENNIFGGQSFKWNTPGSAWYVQAIWEHYAFTKDKTWLGSFGYPILKEVVEFWDDHLKRRPDGVLVSPMGWSPEHGPTEDGVSYDQEIVYDLFTNYIAAADALDIDKTYRDHVAGMRDHLLKPKIGKWGQLQEWETDRDDPKDNHRHASHLFGLYPGRQISPALTPALANAAKISLQARGDASTGWSMAWKMNYWARLLDGDHAYIILKNFINLVGGSGMDYNEGGGVYANLFCAHPPFQIDGNFGYTAGVAEMLVQSQTDEIQLLPALPEGWKDGHVQGLKTRGGFEITGMQWKNGKIVKLTIRSLAGGDCNIRVPNALEGEPGVLNNAGTAPVYRYNFKTRAGKLYSFTAEKNTLKARHPLPPGTAPLPYTNFFKLRSGLNNSYQAIVKNKTATVGFLGGSITFNPGWRNMVCTWLQERFPATRFNFIAAGIPSLGSLPHAFRFQRDLLDSGKIDLLFVEAAVNDRANGTDTVTQLRSLEGIIRHARRSNPSMDIILMSFADPYKTADYSKGVVPAEVGLHELVASHYQLPSINLAKEISDKITHHEFTWKDDFKDVHPSPFGQELYFETIRALLERSYPLPPSRPSSPSHPLSPSHSSSSPGHSIHPHPMPGPLDKSNFDKGHYYDLSNAVYDKDWTLNPSWKPSNNQSTRDGFVNVPMLTTEKAGAVLTLPFTGNAVGIAVVSGDDAGILSYAVDDAPFKTVDLYTQWSSWLHLPWYVLLGSGLREGKHKLTIRVGDEKNANSKGHACRIVHFFVNN